MAFTANDRNKQGEALGMLPWWIFMAWKIPKLPSAKLSSPPEFDMSSLSGRVPAAQSGELCLEKKWEFVICPPLPYPFQHRLSRHWPYQFFIFSSLSPWNADVIYHVPILNFNLKEISETLELELKKGCDVIT